MAAELRLLLDATPHLRSCLTTPADIEELADIDGCTTMVAAFPTAKEDAAAAKDESSAARASAIGKRLLGGASSVAGGSGSAVSSATGTAGSEGASSSSAGDAKTGKPKWLKM